MSDLISRKVLNEYLDSQIKDVSESIPDRVFTKDVLKTMRTTGEAVKKYVSSMPDAYDVDKVVEQIVNNIVTLDMIGWNVISITKAIEIVREGAVKDE
jgi:hypothetical protein